MITLSEWERKNFIHSSDKNTPGLTVIFPSREIYFSEELLHLMRLENSTCPKTLDQWYELCHPEDHRKLSRLEKIIYGHEDEFFSITRKLYCGDGVYRNFRLDAFITRYSDGRPKKLIGNENLALSSWLSSANEGDKIECNGKILEAVRVGGVMTLNNLSMIEDLKDENLRLRREIQRRVFYSGKSPAEITLPEADGSEEFFANILETNIDSALEILTANSQLKSLKRSVNNENLIIGVAGLSGSGKSTFVNALIGEKLIPEHTEIPIFCREGEVKSAKIFYQDGRNEIITGSKLTASYLRELRDTARIEITIPGALIPEGICVADSVGKNILPELDMIIYVTPIRARLKYSDYEYLKLILSINENIIFVLSQIDLEREDLEAGKIIYTVQDKISSDIESIKSSVKKFCGLEVEVVPVSARNALEKFYDKNSSLWSDSNLENFVNYIKPLGKNSFVRALRLRTERALKILENSEIKTSSDWKMQEINENLGKVPRNLLTSWPSKISKWNVNISTDTEKTSKNLLSSLVASMREREFKGKFFSLKAFNGKRSAILLGADKTQSIKLFSRLAHNLSLENLPDGGTTSSEWLCSGKIMPFSCVQIPVTGSDENILIAPSDSEINSNIDWPKLFSKYIPVVSVDLARIDSGLSDLAYSPYITELAFSKWVLAFGNAALFDKRQIELVSEVPERIKEFTESNGLITPDYFIFENYKVF